MLKARILIIVFILSIPDSFCRNELVAEESFVELRVFQKILYDYSELTGQTSCWNMIAEQPMPYYYVRPFIKNSVCQGEITSCAWAGDITACASTIDRFKIRWVKGVRDGNHYVHGQPDNCSEKGALAMYRTNTDRSVCVCNCFQNNWGIHVGLMQSRESDNYVITRIRFIIRDNILYLQAAEGKLGANLTISGFSWIPLPTDPSEIRRIDRASANFFLDDVKLQKDYALTGVKFEYMEASKPKMVKGFGISVSGRPFLNTGHLNLKPGNTLTIKTNPSVHWSAWSDQPVPTDVLGIPMNRPDDHEYVELVQSSYKVDYGQSTLPLFRNPHANEQDVLLSGFGIFLETLATERFITLRAHPR